MLHKRDGKTYRNHPQTSFEAATPALVTLLFYGYKRMGGIFIPLSFIGMEMVIKAMDTISRLRLKIPPVKKYQSIVLSQLIENLLKCK